MNVEREQAVQLLTAQKAKQSQSVQVLAAQKAEQQQSVQVLTARLAEREKELREIKNSKVWKFALLLRRIRLLLVPPNSLLVRMLRQLMDLAKGRKIKGDSALLRSSGLFDEVWYLEQNPDIAQAKVDPVLHYLLYGGFKGRNPGLDFDGNWYLDTYEDVKEGRDQPTAPLSKIWQSRGT